MKKLALFLVISLCLTGCLTAQVWQSIYSHGRLLGVNANGKMYLATNEGILGSDNPNSWQTIMECENAELYGFAVSKQGRIFVLPNNQYHILISDNDGETWVERNSFLNNYLEKAHMYAVSNDTLLVYGSGTLHWTFDGGTTWGESSLPFIEEGVSLGDMIVDQNNNVFISTYNWLLPVSCEMGIFNAPLSNLGQWHQWASVEGGVKDLDLDHFGNVFATTGFGNSFQHQYGLYLIPVDRIGLANNGIVYTMERVDEEHVVLAYSTDKGEHFTQFGEYLSSNMLVPDTDMGLFKGLDQHLYCHRDNPNRKNFKSNHIADNIVSGFLDNYWVDLVTERPEGYVIEANGNVQIWSSEALAWLISTVNGLNGQEPDDFSGKQVTLRANVNMSDAIWTTIAQGTNYGNPNPDRLKFCGTFDGNGFEISGLFLYSPTTEEFSSFFGHLCGATIKNMTIRHTCASGRSDKDGLFFANADAQTIINHCYFEVDNVYKSDMNEDYSIFGYLNEGIITNSLVRCKKVDYEGQSGINMDLFVRINHGTIQNCASVADSLKWLYSFGGMAGTNHGLIENCYSFIGDWFGDYQIWWPPTPRQGMCMDNYGIIRNCYYNSLYGFVDNAAYYNEGIIDQTSAFMLMEKWQLVDSVLVQGQGGTQFETNDLVEALDVWANCHENSNAFMSWCENASFLGHSLPELCNYIDFESFCEPPSSWFIGHSSNQGIVNVHFSWNKPLGFRWLHYDTNPYEGSVHSYYWGIRIPAEEIQSGDVLTHVAFYKAGFQNQPLNYRFMFYTGGDMEPEQLVYVPSTSVSLEPGPDEWVMVQLRNPINCEEGKSLWIIVEDVMSGGNNAPYCQTSGNPDGRWANNGGSTWYDYSSLQGEGGDWMIRGYFNNYINCNEEFDHYNLYRGRSSEALERIAEIGRDEEEYYDTLQNPFGDYYYSLTASYSNGCESDPEKTLGYFHVGNISSLGSEWYYEILNENGSTTYQHLEYAADTTINNKDVKIIIRTNTLYDKGIHNEVTHEYIYEDFGKVYWWNKELNSFTILYDLGAQVGDEWNIHVGTETITMHVNSVEQYVYEGTTYRLLLVSDAEGLFSGEIMSGVGHLTSFFPERLMTQSKAYRVEGIRCYWREGELVFKYGDKDCDEVYEQYHHGLDEMDDAAFAVYPNPTDGIITISGLQSGAYRITNIVGQTVLTGCIDDDNQRIDVSALPKGMYFITVGDTTMKFVVNK